eukprot:6679310-Prymnesium_polylepis.1
MLVAASCLPDGAALLERVLVPTTVCFEAQTHIHTLDKAKSSVRCKHKCRRRLAESATQDAPPRGAHRTDIDHGSAPYFAFAHV